MDPNIVINTGPQNIQPKISEEWAIQACMMWRNAEREVPHVGEAGRLYGGNGRELWLPELIIRDADRTDASRLFPIVVIP